MAQYISKSALVAEIERRIKEISKECEESKTIQFTLIGKINALENLLPFLELARVAAFNGHQSLMEGIFPELAESKNEKTRKRIIALVNAHGQGMYKDDMLAWLEKHGKKNSVTTKEEEKVREQVVYAINKLNVPESEKNKLLAWLEKQGEQKPIINVPPREVILAIWDLGNEWKELTNGSISTEYGTQLDYIQKHWQESEYYLREKQGEQKPGWSNKEKLMLNDIIEATERSNIFMEDYQRELVDWLKSLEQRIGGKL